MKIRHICETSVESLLKFRVVRNFEDDSRELFKQYVSISVISEACPHPSDVSLKRRNTIANTSILIPLLLVQPCYYPIYLFCVLVSQGPWVSVLGFLVLLPTAHFLHPLLFERGMQIGEIRKDDYIYSFSRKSWYERDIIAKTFMAQTLQLFVLLRRS